MAGMFSNAMALSKSSINQLDAEIDAIELQQSNMNLLFDKEKNQLKLKKNEHKQVQDSIKNQEKKEKIEADLMKQMLASEGKGSIAIGDDLVSNFATPTEPEAQNLPLLDTL